MSSADEADNNKIWTRGQDRVSCWNMFTSRKLQRTNCSLPKAALVHCLPLPVALPAACSQCPGKPESSAAAPTHSHSAHLVPFLSSCFLARSRATLMAINYPLMQKHSVLRWHSLSDQGGQWRKEEGGEGLRHPSRYLCTESLCLLLGPSQDPLSLAQRGWGGGGSPPCQTLYLMQRTKGAGHPLTYPPPPPPPSRSPSSFGLVESNSSRDIRVEGSSEKIDPGLPIRFLQDLYSWLHLPIASHSSEHSVALHACTPLWSW